MHFHKMYMATEVFGKKSMAAPEREPLIAHNAPLSAFKVRWNRHCEPSNATESKSLRTTPLLPQKSSYIQHGNKAQSDLHAKELAEGRGTEAV